jgi:hypothetical protein
MHIPLNVRILSLLMGTKVETNCGGRRINLKHYESISFNGEQYKIVKVSATNGGNVIVNLLNKKTGDEAEMILWQKGY